MEDASDPGNARRGRIPAVFDPAEPETQRGPGGMQRPPAGSGRPGCVEGRRSNAVRVRLPALFADRIDGVDTVEVEATTVEGALRALTLKHAALATLVWTAGSALNPLMVLFLNNRQLARSDIEETLRPGDQLEIIPAIEGGYSSCRAVLPVPD